MPTTCSPSASAACSTRSWSSAVIALGFVVVSVAGTVFYAFGDILLLFFLSWLLSFALLPLINAVARIAQGPAGRRGDRRLPRDRGRPARDHHPGLRRPRVTSISDFIKNAPQLRDQLANVLRGPRRRGWPALGLNVDLVGQAPQIVGNLQDCAAPARGAAPVDRRRQHRHLRQHPDPRDPVDLHRDRPGRHPGLPATGSSRPRYVPQARVLQVSVSRSFGGFLRGQLIMGLVVRPVHRSSSTWSSGCQYAGADDGRWRACSR